MTLFVVILLGAGALLMVSAIEDVSLADTFNAIRLGDLPSSVGSSVGLAGPPPDNQALNPKWDKRPK
jgi:hypothetical protein